MRVTFTCGTEVSDPAVINELLRLGDLTSKYATSGVMALDWEIPCARVDFQQRAVELCPLPVLAHWLRARGSSAPPHWSREPHVTQVHLLQGQRLRALESRAHVISAAAAVLNDDAATADAKAAATTTLQSTAAGMDSDPTILSKDFFLNQFYHKLLRHAFLPEQVRFNNQARMLSFCNADYATIQVLLALIAPAISAEQATVADKLSVKNCERAVDLVDAGYIHLSFFRFQDTMLFTTDNTDDKGVRCIVVRASVIASMNSTHYVTRILFTQNESTGQWEATKQMKNCQCVSGSELEKLWCTHMAGVFVALAKLVRNRVRSLGGLEKTWPDDIVLLQAQPVRLSLVVGRRAFARDLLASRADDSGADDDGAGSDDTDDDDDEEEDEDDHGAGGGGGAAAVAASRPRRRTLGESGVKSLSKQDVDADRREYIQGGLDNLMQRRHISVVRRLRTVEIDPTNSVINTDRNTYRPSASEE